MKINEYVELRKKELDSFKKLFIDGNRKEPDNWPLENDLIDWYEQEIAYN